MPKQHEAVSWFSETFIWVSKVLPRFTQRAAVLTQVSHASRVRTICAETGLDRRRDARIENHARGISGERRTMSSRTDVRSGEAGPRDCFLPGGKWTGKWRDLGAVTRELACTSEMARRTRDVTRVKAGKWLRRRLERTPWIHVTPRTYIVSLYWIYYSILCTLRISPMFNPVNIFISLLLWNLNVIYILFSWKPHVYIQTQNMKVTID